MWKAGDVISDTAVYEYAVLGTAGRKGNCYRVEHGPRCLDETLGESVEQMLNLTQQPVSADWLLQTNVHCNLQLPMFRGHVLSFLTRLSCFAAGGGVTVPNKASSPQN